MTKATFVSKMVTKADFLIYYVVYKTVAHTCRAVVKSLLMVPWSKRSMMVLYKTLTN